MRDSGQSLPALKEQLGKVWENGSPSQHQRFASGHLELDTYLKGGFQRGQLHEIFAAEAEDNGSACGFAAMLSQCAMQQGKNVLWLRTPAAIHKGGRFNPVGLAELGGDPARLLVAIAVDDTALLRSAIDALRCDGFAAAVMECWGSPAILDLTASRRITLAADRSGATAFLLRLDSREQPSTASTRWSVRSAPASPLAANAPGYPTLDITLLRHRAGPAGQSWRVEWDRDSASFRHPSQHPNSVSEPYKRSPVSRPVVPVPGVGPAAIDGKIHLIA